MVSQNYTKLLKKITVTRFCLCCLAVIVLCLLIYIPVYYITVAYCKKITLEYFLGWNNFSNRDTKTYIQPDKLTTIHEPRYVCSRNQTNKIFLLVIICSATKNFEERNEIRSTWGDITKYVKIAKFYNAIKNKYEAYQFSYNDIWNFDNEDVISGVKSLKDNASYYNDSYNPKGYENTIGVKKETLDTENEKRKVNNTSYKVKSNVDDFKVIFVLGLPSEDAQETQRSIDEEVLVNGDIIQENFVDSYYNLTLKSIMMLKWLTRNCNGRVRYVAKTDDDVYLNVPNLVWNLRNKSRRYDDQVLSGYKKKEYLLMGEQICGNKPQLNATSKWYSPLYMYSRRFYPPYLSGLRYVFTVHTAQALYDAALNTEYFHIEDVFITGICASRSVPRIEHTTDPTFDYQRAIFCDICCVYSHVAVHDVTASKRRELHQLLTSYTLLDRCERKILIKKERQRRLCILNEHLGLPEPDNCGFKSKKFCIRVDVESAEFYLHNFSG